MFGPTAALNTIHCSYLKLLWIKLVGQKVVAKTTHAYDLKNVTLTSYLYKGKHHLVDYKEEE